MRTLLITACGSRCPYPGSYTQMLLAAMGEDVRHMDIVLIDNSLWARLTDSSRAGEMDLRQKLIIYEGMKALIEFDELVKKGEIDPKRYKVPLVPFR